MIRKKLLLLTGVMLCLLYRAAGQSTCAQTLRLAQSIYEQGRLHELPQLLESCVRAGFTDAEKVNAYKLLTLTYIYLEEPVKADEMMLALLRTETEFKVNDAVDPAEFVALYKTFRTYPIYRIGGKLGAVATEPSIVSADFVDDGSNTYKYSFGFSGALSSEIPIWHRTGRFSLNPELCFQYLSFKGKNAGADPTRVTDGRESEAWISLPVLLQYQILQKGITHYFVGGGLAADYLLASSLTIVTNRDGNSPVEEKPIDVMEQRNHFNAGAILAGGFKRKIGKGFLVAEIRYKLGMLPMLEREDTYENSELVIDYKYVDGIFKLNTLSLSLGYVLNRYHPKKLSSK